MKSLNILEAIEELNKGNYLTDNKDKIFYLKDEYIKCKSNNYNIKMKIDDFISLYKKSIFYIYEDDNLIDENKDEDYYRYYHK